MAGRNSRRTAARTDDTLRSRITQEAARIMAEEGVRDYAAAKRKAAARLNLEENHHLPSNREIEEALADHLRLFHARDLPPLLRTHLGVAIEAMHLLERFAPRLVGPLLNGMATPFSEVPIHAFPDDPEQLAVLLQEHGIPYEEDSRRLRYGGDRQETAPVFRFFAGDTQVEVIAFSPQAGREAPLSPVDARPMRRANLKEVERLREQAGAQPPAF
jgi:hypothetical protein